MNVYIIGNLLGRLFLSYSLVWIGMLVASRIDWRQAFRRTHRWYGAVSVAAMFSIGLAIAMA